MQFQKYPHPDFPETSIYFKNQGDVQQYAKSVGDKKSEHAEQEEVELNKDSVLERLNAHEEEKRSFLSGGVNRSDQVTEAVATPIEGETEAEAPRDKEEKPPVRSYLQNDIVEAINDADPSMFGRIFEASICRLGELRAEGWDVFSSLSRDLDVHNAALERGLGSLVLAAAVLTGEDPQGQVIQRLRKRKPKEPAPKRGFVAPKSDNGI